MKRIISVLLTLAISLSLFSVLAFATNNQENKSAMNMDISDGMLSDDTMESLKQNSHANRAFLGWNGKVYPSKTAAFADAFWPLVGTMSIQNAAVQAADEVPGKGTTPIRFYGDDYYGTAWN